MITSMHFLEKYRDICCFHLQTNNSLTLPTFLVGITGPSVQDGVAPPPPDNVDLAINALMPNSPPGSITSNVSEYHSYLVDARYDHPTISI